MKKLASVVLVLAIAIGTLSMGVSASFWENQVDWKNHQGVYELYFEEDSEIDVQYYDSVTNSW